MQRRITTIIITLSLLLGVALGRVPLVHGWTMTGDLNVARSFHTATVLPNGHVLVYGGITADGGTGFSILDSAELYDPATGIWTLTGNTFYYRYGHTATLLPNGRVLAVGGGFNTNSEEEYDPPTGNWYATSPLLVERINHTATLLSNGRVLVAGGWNGSFPYPDSYLHSAAVYDPDTFRWTPTGDLNVGRWGHVATLLPDGRVLVAGGFVNSGGADSAEVYDPATGVWTPTDSMFYERLGQMHTATGLQDGKVLVAGGYINDGSGRSLDRVDVYNPARGAWEATSRLTTARRYHAATLLPNGRVLVAGGLNPAAAGVHLNSAEAYNPVTHTWTPSAPLNVARAFHTMTVLPNGRVLVAGGDDATSGSHSLNSTEVYDSALTCSVITISPTSTPPATQGATYGVLFDEIGSSGIPVWSISAGTLPTGLAFEAANGRALLTGMPTVVGTFHFTARATNGNCIGERAYTLVVTGMSATAVPPSPSPLP